MKKLYLLLLKSYAGSFIITFFIAVFIFLMVFVFTYIDEFVGKDIQPLILLELFFYFSLNTISKALPLAILLSGIMTMGNMTEHYEITAMKSSGISFFKITRPLFVFAISMNVFMLAFSNIILPDSNLQLQTLLISVRASKPALLFKEGVFNNSLKGYSIRIGKISSDGKIFQDIMIYDHSESKGNTMVMIAKTGQPLEYTSHGILFFILNDGTSYKEVTNDTTLSKNNTFIRSRFEQRIIRFNLSDFMFSKADSKNFKNDYTVLNMNQLTAFIDSLKISNLRLAMKLKTVDSAMSLHTTQKAEESSALKKDIINQMEINDSRIIKYSIEWHTRMVSSFSCILFFLIGVPLGYVIKKGGLGMPVVISTALFILFHVLSMIGEKLAEGGILTVYLGTWMSLLVFFPPTMLLFYMASADRLSLENPFKRMKQK